MEDIFLNFCYIVGMISFTITGCWTCLKQRQLLISPICTILSAFGGGMVFRDIILLRMMPSALVEPHELIMAICFSFWFAHLTSKHEFAIYMLMDRQIVQTILDLADALGSGAFISIGYLKAMEYGLPSSLCVVSGIVTTFGGGMLAALVRGNNVKSVLKASLGYRLIIIINALHLYKLHIQGVPIDTARCIVIVSTALPCVGRSFVLNKSFRCLLCQKLTYINATHLIDDEPAIILLHIFICYVASNCILLDKNTLKKYYSSHTKIKNIVRRHVSAPIFSHRPISFSAI